MIELRNDTDDLDYELRSGEGWPEDLPPPRRAGLLIVVGALIIATAIAAYIAFGGRKASGPSATDAGRVAAPQESVRPLGGASPPIDLPPLDETDPLVRELVQQVTTHPRIAAWLTTHGLIRNFAVVVSNVAEGKTPARQLQVLRPSAAFHVVDRGSGLYVDPRSYERYDGLAAAALSIDPAGAARLYATLKPRIEEAARDLGEPDGSFDRVLERAIVRLLETPTVEDPVRVRPQGATGYGFAAPELEALPAAQKQLLRMGPWNVRTIQSALRRIALALGIPPERLPPPGKHPQ